MKGNLILKDGTKITGEVFGYQHSVAGEVVFTTGMTGYPEALTDPSFEGQILTLTYPLIGNYGVPDKSLWESDKPHIKALIVSDYIDTPSHFQSKETLSHWLKREKVPGLVIKDTRELAQHLRDNGATLGKIQIDKEIEWYDPNIDDLLSQVTVPNVQVHYPENHPSPKTSGWRGKTVVLIDCGAKRNITRCFLKRGVRVITVPWNYDVFGNNSKFKFDALFVSNGPGDPIMAKKAIVTMRKSMENKIPTMGICLGSQILALAAGGDTYKLKFGHRSQNQPCTLIGTSRSYVTTQNHGFAVGKIPPNFKPWFVNSNDNTNEGIIHEKMPFMSVQFHPEANPGPKDAEWIFDYFVEKMK